MNYSKIKYFCTINMAGFCTSIYVSGCDMQPHCKGCFNQAAWDFNNGKPFTEATIDKILSSIEPIYNNGLSILGGEPLACKNLDGVLHLVERFREKFGNTKQIWIWSGHYYKDMTDKQKEIVHMCDYLVDGPFDEDLFSDKLRFKGSSNQTVWKIEDGKLLVSKYN